MTLSLILACLWGLAANFLAMLPSKDNHWTRAWWLIGTGVPILGFVLCQNGPWMALLVLVAAMSVLRWPLRYLLAWVSRRVTGHA